MKIPLQNITLVDRIELPQTVLKSFQETGIAFLLMSVESWSEEVLQKVSQGGSIPQFRMITIFGAEYILNNTSSETKNQVARAIFLSLEPGGLIFIAPENFNLTNALNQLSGSGLQRVAKDIACLYQKSTKRPHKA